MMISEITFDAWNSDVDAWMVTQLAAIDVDQEASEYFRWLCPSAEQTGPANDVIQWLRYWIESAEVQLDLLLGTPELADYFQCGFLAVRHDIIQVIGVSAQISDTRSGPRASRAGAEVYRGAAGNFVFRGTTQEGWDNWREKLLQLESTPLEQLVADGVLEIMTDEEADQCISTPSRTGATYYAEVLGGNPSGPEMDGSAPFTTEPASPRVSTQPEPC